MVVDGRVLHVPLLLALIECVQLCVCKPEDHALHPCALVSLLTRHGVALQHDTTRLGHAAVAHEPPAWEMGRPNLHDID